MKKILFLILILGACGSPKPNYKIVEDQKYDIPAKSQISLRIVLKDTVNRRNVTEVLEREFRLSMKRSMKYQNPPSHIFIYVYDSATDWKQQTGNWVGTIQRIANENKEIRFSEAIVP